MSIAKHKGASGEEAVSITREFADATKYASKHNLNPAPTARDFIAKLSIFAARPEIAVDVPEEKDETEQNETRSNKRAKLEPPQPA